MKPAPQPRYSGLAAQGRSTCSSKRARQYPVQGRFVREILRQPRELKERCHSARAKVQAQILPLCRPEIPASKPHCSEQWNFDWSKLVLSRPSPIHCLCGQESTMPPLNGSHWCSRAMSQASARQARPTNQEWKNLLKPCCGDQQHSSCLISNRKPQKSTRQISVSIPNLALEPSPIKMESRLCRYFQLL